jgi:hypothetical protein
VLEPIDIIEDFNDVVDTFKEVMAEYKPRQTRKKKIKRND